MTRTGEPNRFGRFVLDEEQAQRIAAGDYSAVWEFIKQNNILLVRWARRKIYTLLNCAAGSRFYEVDELINQIFVDFQYYDITSERSIFICMWWTFKGIGCGGYKGKRNSVLRAISLNAHVKVSERSGDSSDGAELIDLLESYEPLPDRVLVDKEHVQEIAGHYYSEIRKALCVSDDDDKGATVAELIDAKKERAYTRQKQFRDVIEYVFHGYRFEEIKQYAQNNR